MTRRSSVPVRPPRPRTIAVQVPNHVLGLSSLRAAASNTLPTSGREFDSHSCLCNRDQATQTAAERSKPAPGTGPRSPRQNRPPSSTRSRGGASPCHVGTRVHLRFVGGHQVGENRQREVASRRVPSLQELVCDALGCVAHVVRGSTLCAFWRPRTVQSLRGHPRKLHSLWYIRLATVTGG